MLTFQVEHLHGVGAPLHPQHGRGVPGPVRRGVVVEEAVEVAGVQRGGGHHQPQGAPLPLDLPQQTQEQVCLEAPLVCLVNQDDAVLGGRVEGVKRGKGEG